MAAISAADPEIGAMIAEAIDKVGKDGVITVEESQTFGMEMDLVEGMRFDKGYISPYFVTDPERMEAVLEDPYVLLVGSKISAVRDLLPVLEKIMQTGKPLVVIAEDVEGEALATLVVNKIRGTFKSAGVKAPGFGERRKAMLQDMAILTGGQVVTEEVGLKLENVTLDLLGRARKVVITKDETTVVEGAGEDSDIKGRISQIKTEIENTDSDYDREKLQERLAKLSGGVAVIKVGAATEVELKEKKHRIEDAVSTTKAAIEEGVVPGGGVALLRAQKTVLDRAEKLDGDEATGARIVAKAVEEPLKQIAVNAGLEGGVVVDKVRNLSESRRGAERRHRRLRGPLQGGRDRRRQGDPFGAAERCVDRGPLPHHRGGRRRQAGEGVGAGDAGRRRHGRLLGRELSSEGAPLWGRPLLAPFGTRAIAAAGFGVQSAGLRRPVGGSARRLGEVSTGETSGVVVGLGRAAPVLQGVGPGRRFGRRRCRGGGRRRQGVAGDRGSGGVRIHPRPQGGRLHDGDRPRPAPAALAADEPRPRRPLPGKLLPFAHRGLGVRRRASGGDARGAPPPRSSARRDARLLLLPDVEAAGAGRQLVPAPLRGAPRADARPWQGRPRVPRPGVAARDGIDRPRRLRVGRDAVRPSGPTT